MSSAGKINFSMSSDFVKTFNVNKYGCHLVMWNCIKGADTVHSLPKIWDRTVFIFPPLKAKTFVNGCPGALPARHAHICKSRICVYASSKRNTWRRRGTAHAQWIYLNINTLAYLFLVIYFMLFQSCILLHSW